MSREVSPDAARPDRFDVCDPHSPFSATPATHPASVPPIRPDGALDDANFASTATAAEENDRNDNESTSAEATHDPQSQAPLVAHASDVEDAPAHADRHDDDEAASSSAADVLSDTRRSVGNIFPSDSEGGDRGDRGHHHSTLQLTAGDCLEDGGRQALVSQSAAPSAALAGDTSDHSRGLSPSTSASAIVAPTLPQMEVDEHDDGLGLASEGRRSGGKHASSGGASKTGSSKDKHSAPVDTSRPLGAAEAHAFGKFGKRSPRGGASGVSGSSGGGGGASAHVDEEAEMSEYPSPIVSLTKDDEKNDERGDGQHQQEETGPMIPLVGPSSGTRSSRELPHGSPRSPKEHERTTTTTATRHVDQNEGLATAGHNDNERHDHHRRVEAGGRRADDDENDDVDDDNFQPIVSAATGRCDGSGEYGEYDFEGSLLGGSAGSPDFGMLTTVVEGGGMRAADCTAAQPSGRRAVAFDATADGSSSNLPSASHSQSQLQSHVDPTQNVSQSLVADLQSSDHTGNNNDDPANPPASVGQTVRASPRNQRRSSAPHTADNELALASASGPLSPVFVDGDLHVNNNNDDDEEEEEETQSEKQEREAAVAAEKLALQERRWRHRRKHVFILTSAGKPVFTRWGDESDFSELFGIVQVIAEMVAEAKEELKWVAMGEHVMHFLRSGELTLVLVAATQEAVSACVSQLKLLRNQIIAALPTVNRILEQQPGYDVRQMFAAGDVTVLKSLISRMGNDPSYFFDALRVLPMALANRTEITDAMRHYHVKPTNDAGADDAGDDDDDQGEHLFAYLFCRDQLVAAVSPPDMPLATEDALLLLNFATCAVATNEEVWAPLCLPEFNDSGYLWCHVRRLGLDSIKKKMETASAKGGGSSSQSSGLAGGPESPASNRGGARAAGSPPAAAGNHHTPQHASTNATTSAATNPMMESAGSDTRTASQVSTIRELQELQDDLQSVYSSNLILVQVGTDQAQFGSLALASRRVEEDLEKHGLLRAVLTASTTLPTVPSTPRTKDLGQFFYCAGRQLTMSRWPAHMADRKDRKALLRRLVSLRARALGSCQCATPFVMHSTSEETIVVEILRGAELYACFLPSGGTQSSTATGGVGSGATGARAETQALADIYRHLKAARSELFILKMASWPS